MTTMAINRVNFARDDARCDLYINMLATQGGMAARRAMNDAFLAAGMSINASMAIEEYLTAAGEIEAHAHQPKGQPKATHYVKLPGRPWGRPVVTPALAPEPGQPEPTEEPPRGHLSDRVLIRATDRIYDTQCRHLASLHAQSSTLSYMDKKLDRIEAMLAMLADLGVTPPA